MTLYWRTCLYLITFPNSVFFSANYFFDLAWTLRSNRIYYASR